MRLQAAVTNVSAQGKIAEWRAAHRGRVVKPTGDGLLAKVASVVDAVAASVKCGCDGRYIR